MVIIMFNIRRYKETDRERLRYICKETAWDSYKKNKSKLASVPALYNDYFAECEPENIFVAADENDRAVGYVICAANTELFEREISGHYKRLATGFYPPVIFHYLRFMIAYRSIPAKYRAHLHINLLPEYQRKGLGTRLLSALFEELEKNGISYASVIDVNKRSGSYPFYRSCGFREINRYISGRVTMTRETKGGVSSCEG